MKSSDKVLHWAPRIICILAILFISLFALDSFAPGVPFQKQIIAFLIHLIPSFILTTLLAVAWKWELAGGIIFTVIGIVFTPLIFMHNYSMNHSIWLSSVIILTISFPFIITGILFIANHYKKRT